MPTKTKPTVLAGGGAPTNVTEHEAAERAKAALTASTVRCRGLKTRCGAEPHDRALRAERDAQHRENALLVRQVDQAERRAGQAQYTEGERLEAELKPWYEENLALLAGDRTDLTPRQLAAALLVVNSMYEIIGKKAGGNARIILSGEIAERLSAAHLLRA